MGVFENDVGPFAAEFELDAFEISGGGLDNLLAGDSGAGEGDLVDARMLR